MPVGFDGLQSTAWPPGLTPGAGANVGVDPGRLEAAVAVLDAEIEAGRLPGAVAVVVRDSRVVLHRALGWAQMTPERRPMRPDTLFDLASLTKVMATLPAVLLLLERGAFRLDDPIGLHLPGEAGPWLEQVRIRHLLTHTAGLPASVPLRTIPGTRADRLRALFQVPLEAEPGARLLYSDLSFMLLGLLVERLTGQTLDRFVREQIFAPLGLPSAGFNPPADRQADCAATEFREHLGRHQCGEVHDQNSTALGGVAGHAGLFATAAEVAAYGQMWLNGGTAGGVRILAPATIAAAVRDQTVGLPEGRGLGWVVARAGSEYLSCGDLFTPGSFGHTGFTGTSLWMDPEQRLVVALLTNRVHLGRTDHILRLRPRFHNAVAAALL